MEAGDAAGDREGVQALQEADPPILHRDIKGDNILVSKDGRPMISDFGLARPDYPGWEDNFPSGVWGNRTHMVIPAAAKPEQRTFQNFARCPACCLFPSAFIDLLICKPGNPEYPLGLLPKLCWVCKCRPLKCG